MLVVHNVHSSSSGPSHAFDKILVSSEKVLAITEVTGKRERDLSAISMTCVQRFLIS